MYIVTQLRRNKDDKVIEDFGEEWNFFDNKTVDKLELYNTFQQYFSSFPWDKLPKNAEGFDMGCGSGRWAQFVAPKVKVLNCIEPSSAINIAKDNLKRFTNVNFLQETTESCTIPDLSQDFGYCLGVLHHIPDTERALRDCSRLLKKGAPFLLYLYYNFENRPFWFKVVWTNSNLFRKFISRQNIKVKIFMSYILALLFYYPLSSLSKIIEKIGLNVENIPLSFYRNKSFYVMRNDALDRFGTKLEQRFSKNEIINMLERSGFENIIFSTSAPYWCCVSHKKK